jgi:two-component system, OmpR family, sensor histidine kinase KdpD
VDGDKIERLLLNLVDNALKYTNRETQVIIRAHMPDAEGRVRVEVADHGPGVPEDYKQRLFDRYVQIKGRRSARGGVGLGLTFCRLVVEAHGGSIWIEDNQPNGSIFAFTLPALKQEAVAE